MSGVEIIDTLLSYVEDVRELKNELIEAVKNLAHAQTVLIYADSPEKTRDAKSKVVACEADLKCIRIRSQANGKITSVLQTVSKVVS